MAELEVSFDKTLLVIEGEGWYNVEPCPFCQSDTGEFGESGGHISMIWVYCGNCGARGPNEYSYKRATDSWNNRE